MEKRNLKVNYIDSNNEKKDEHLYTFVLPKNDYIKTVEIEDKEKKKKEELKNK